jgi:hypothetical protein
VLVGRGSESVRPGRRREEERQMTTDRARKRDVRARMAKTGERYTAARRHTAAAGPWATDDLGQTDETIRRGSGRGWGEWIRVLDAWGARDRTHTEIARHVSEDLHVDGWWAQSVTVGYERARGMRAPHQRPDGFCVYASKTVGVDRAVLRSAFVEAKRRDAWLERGTLKLRPNRSESAARFDHPADGSRVVAWFTEKGPGRSSVQIQHERLPDEAAVATMKAFWRERLARLAATL